MKAPDFGNGLFLAATNLGTTIGTMICGLLIAKMGISFILFGGIGLMMLALANILLRVIFLSSERKKESKLFIQNEGE